MSGVEGSDFYDAPPVFSTQLVEARQRQQLSLEQVADKLKVPVAYLRAIEDGRIEGLPNVAFVRGYLRAYARLLELDADQLVAAFNEAFVDHEHEVTTIDRVHAEPTTTGPLAKLAIWGFVLAIVGLSIWWWQSQNGRMVELPVTLDAVEESEPQPQQVAPADQVDAEFLQQPKAAPLAPESVEPEEPSTAIPAEPGPLELDVEPEPQETERVASAPQAEQIVAQQQQQSERTEPEPSVEVIADRVDLAIEEPVGSVLKMSFTGECWLSIQTLEGKVVYADLMQPGETLERELSSLPVRLLVGQVSVVEQAFFKGQELALVELARKDVARLTLE